MKALREELAEAGDRAPRKREALIGPIALELTTPSFHGKAKVLKELVLHHAKAEDNEMFALARSLMGKAELDALGEAMARRKKELLGKHQNGAARQRSVGASA